jgi:hypothetical protein
MTLLYLICVVASLVSLAVALRHHPAPPPPPLAPVTPAALTDTETRLILAAAAQLAHRLDTAA